MATRLSRLIIRFILMSTFVISFVSSQEWSYGVGTGPSRWSDHYPACGGRKQSPINIVSRSTSHKKNLELVFVNYNQPVDGQFTVMNLGHQVQVSIPDGVKLGVETGSRRVSAYKLAQFHFHWGSDDSSGSEHSIDGKFYPMEIHLVHYNSDFYPDFATAVNETDGLAVLAILVGVSASANVSAIEDLTLHFSEIAHKGDHKVIPSFRIGSLLPTSNLDYFRYFGSLTTPPCYESVIWSVFKSQISVTPEQMKRFRTLFHSNLPEEPEENIVNNFRPIQLLNSRKVLRNRPGPRSCGAQGSSGFSSTNLRS